MDDCLIYELSTDNAIMNAYPIMKQLRPHLNDIEYLQLVNDAREKDGYRQLVMETNGEIVAVIGFKPMITLYYGRFIWISDLVTDEQKRSSGYGEKLLSHVEMFAEKEGYECVALSSGLQKLEAHRFYEEKMDYDRVSFVFKKQL